MHWHGAIDHYATLGNAYVVATVLATSGSAPRPAGTKMVVATNAEHDTLGGGQLEHLVIAHARQLLAQETTTQQIEHFPLAASALQCCGGSVTVLLECFAQPALRIAVFGAGHIGQRVVQLASELSAQVMWFDEANRKSEGEVIDALRDIRPQPFSTPATAIAQIPSGSQIIIVSHDHQLDYALLESVLQSGVQRFAGVGMIGSATKWQRFSSRLTAAGFAATDIEKIRCPLGQTGTQSPTSDAGEQRRATDKQPMAIAIAIVNELLNLSGQRDFSEPAEASPLSWRQIKSTLVQTPAHEPNRKDNAGSV
jgi:xanthine dehydrogenase accessory factor